MGLAKAGGLLMGLCALCLGLGAAWAQEEGTAPAEEATCEQQPFSIGITVKNVKKAQGTVTVDLHDDVPENFLKGKKVISRTRAPAIMGETIVCIPVPKAGIYAVAVYHDRNGDTKFDKTWIGLPDEPYGVSNNPPMRLGPPKWKDAAFEVNGPLTPISISLR